MCEIFFFSNSPGKGKNSDIFTQKNGPWCAQALPSAESWGYQATASREKVLFEVRCVRSKPETAKQAPSRQARVGQRLCHYRGISWARSFGLEVTPWAPTRLTSCIFHSGPKEAYEPLRSTRCSARAPFRDLAAPKSTRQASSVQVWHFLGQKLRLGGDALGADPTYLLYLASRSRGGI